MHHYFSVRVLSDNRKYISKGCETQGGLRCATFAPVPYRFLGLPVGVDPSTNSGKFLMFSPSFETYNDRE